MWDTTLEEWTRALPKIELHAHIHGSIRATTLQELLNEDAKRNGTEPRSLPKHRSLDECFEMFHLIHQVVVSRQALRRIVIEAIEDFAAENVKYIELRSTPRALERDGSSRDDYIAEVVSAVEECHARSDLDIQVRLLLSINRNQPLEVAEETLQLALKWREKSPLIVGLDLSGHSERADSEFHRFEKVLGEARQHGLKLAVHFAEHFDDAEAERIMAFRPDRVGHACCLSDAHYSQLMESRIPIEVCLTSNVHTLARFRKEPCGCDAKDENGLCLCGYQSHPHREVVALHGTYPLCICTDDQGVLDTTLSREYARAAQAFSLTKPRLLELARGAIDVIFADELKQSLRSVFNELA
ncbi:hypothetical protein ATCC90586_008615 [Pythium insidiosum]|nr:hypothetical protein ATCC90586_008615 [Pythium insidiosum]